MIGHETPVRNRNSLAILVGCLDIECGVGVKWPTHCDTPPVRYQKLNKIVDRRIVSTTEQYVRTCTATVQNQLNVFYSLHHTISVEKYRFIRSFDRDTVSSDGKRVLV